MERDPEVGLDRSPGPTRSYRRTLAALAARPRLWPEALSTARSLVPRRWWTRAPYLPLPDRRWLRFRMVTAYGGSGRGGPDPDDTVTFVAWRRSFPS